MLSFAMGSVSNGMIFAGINCQNTVTISSVAFNSDALTSVAASITDSASVRMQMYYLVNPDSGTHNMVVTLSGSSGHDTVVASYYDVDQADPIDAVYATWDGATMNTQTYTKSLTTVDADTFIVWQWDNFSGDTGITGASGTTERQSYPGGAGNFGVGWADKPTPTAGSNSLSVQASTVAQGDWYGNILVSVNTDVAPTYTPDPIIHHMQIAGGLM